MAAADRVAQAAGAARRDQFCEPSFAARLPSDRFQARHRRGGPDVTPALGHRLERGRGSLAAHHSIQAGRELLDPHRINL
jgi:hypothetical protein